MVTGGSCAKLAVYPRVCGGTKSTSSPVPHSTGLSPRVRGNPPFNTLHGLLHRSIPACAGEPMIRPVASKAAVVYPRVCGGTALISQELMLAKGLSPRVRGNP